MTPLEILLAKLPGARKSGRGWSARCPAHDDCKSSLTVSAGDYGKVLVKCHAGCDTAAILATIGLKMADLFPPNSSPTPARNGKLTTTRRPLPTAEAAVAALERKHGKRSALWTYHDARGEPVGIVIRWDRTQGKDIRPVARHGDGWRIGAMPDSRPLYSLPDLPTAKCVIVVEGEKAAEAARSLGFAATTSAGGSQAANKTDWLPLAGKEVWILPDNDLPGRKYAETVAGILAKLTPAPVVRVVELPGLHDGADIVDWLEGHGDSAEPGGMREELEKLAQAVEPWRPRDAKPIRSDAVSNIGGQSDDRPKITITTDEHLVNDEASAALARDHAIYQRGGLLVRIVRDTSPTGKGVRRPLGPRIESLPQSLLRERLAANARWVSLRETTEGISEKPARPPAWSVAAVYDRGDWPGVPYLESVVDYPVLRQDGSVLDRPGYDAETGLLLEPAGPLPGVPTSLTHSNALAARDLLLEVVDDFPFERPVYRAAWLAGLLTPLARFAFSGPAPLFLVDANVRAAGKGLMLDVISHIITGERFTIAAYTKDEDELRKRITSLVMAGDRLVLFDNLEGKFGNSVLDAALTANAWKDRVLGTNRMAEAPMYMTWYATGNNVAIAADTARRVCHIRLESPHERPEERHGFRHPNLLEWVGENRHTLLAAALTILRAYCAAGRPNQNLPAWGSFEGWSAMVRSAVVWAGLPDPGETRLLLQEQADVTAESMSIVLACWQLLDPEGRGLTAAEVIGMIFKDPSHNPPEFHSDMRDALEAVLGKCDSRTLGTRLRSFRRRMFQGRFIDHVGKEHKAVRWAVYPLDNFHNRRENTPHTPYTPTTEGECGECRECIPRGPGMIAGNQFRSLDH